MKPEKKEHPMTPRRRSAVAACLCGLALSLPLTATELQPATAPIVNGVNTSGFPSVGYLLLDSGGECTGTLIGCSTFLTAAHCVCTDPATKDTLPGSQCQSRTDLLDPSNKVVWFQHAGPFAVTGVTVHPGYTASGGSDLAILRLAGPVTGIAPSPLNTSGKPPAGTPGIITGFGTSRRSLGDSGLKRTGEVVTSTCNLDDLANANFVCWSFTAPLGAPGTDSNTCAGDSGGPLFTNQGGTLALAGVTSAGRSTECQAPDSSWDSDVFRDRAWIQNVAGGDLGSSSCGVLAGAGSPAARVAGSSFSLSGSSPEARNSFEVPAGATRLRVTLNGQEPLQNDYDLYVRRGSPASTSAFDCSSEEDIALEFCEMANPQPGTWHLLGQYYGGAGGPLQMTATVFAPTQAAGPCARDGDTSCLQGGRFEVNVTWRNSSASGTAKVMSFGGQRTENNEAAFYSFLSPTNFEMGVKILNACTPSLGNKYWVFISGLTDQGWTVNVRDTVTGAVKTYSNAVGRLSQTSADTNAFGC